MTGTPEHRTSTARGILKPRRLEERGRQLAREHASRIGLDIPLEPPAQRVHRAGRKLRRAYEELARSSSRSDDLTPGAAWILDNFYLVRDQLREILLGTSSAHYNRLPRLQDGPYRGAPRIYELMSELLRLQDHAVAEGELTTLVRAYQDVSPLALGELWAVPGAVRVVLIERLASLAQREADAHRKRREAAGWADRILDALRAGSGTSGATAKDLLASRGPMSDAFVLELMGLLRENGELARPVLEQLERRLATREVTLEQLIRREGQRDASLANAFTSLRWAGSTRWGPWVERVSAIERILRLDPSGVYPSMDFETRDRYRRRVEELARGADLDESRVAEMAVEAARSGSSAASPERQAIRRHVGDHLIGPGRVEFERRLSFVPTFRQRVRRAIRARPALTFLGTIAGLFAVLLVLFLAGIIGLGSSPAIVILSGVAGALPILDASVALAHRAFAYLAPPELLPKLDRDQGVDPGEAALVVVPTLLSSPEDARQQVETLATFSFANPQPYLRFALLTDFDDAPERERPGDRETLAAAAEAIRALNERAGGADRFFLLHRERQWSETERSWMGWERKRGKLEELNRLLGDPAAETSYSAITGEFATFVRSHRVRWVVTLDADTRMPPLAAVDLVRTAAHPLNRPHYDPAARRVTRGYGVIQPRVAIGASRGRRSPFKRIMAGAVGLDPYTHAVSDIYQDVFGEGIYTGKGLYDVEAFRRTLDGVVPPGRVLSHDLLESTFARAGLASDITFFDDFPSHYIPWARRLHRWVRGDWQILPWLARRVPTADGRRVRNPIDLLGRWQIFDNVRRSLTPLGLLAFLVTGWLTLPEIAGWWSLLASVLLAFPLYVNATSAVFDRPPNVTWRSWLRRVGRETWDSIRQTAIFAVLLPHHALYQLDAALRALTRMASGRRLLQWTTARQVERTSRSTLSAYLRFMWTEPLLGAVVGVAVWRWAPASLPFALPIIAVWVVAPVLGWVMSRPPVDEARSLTADQTLRLRELGRRTWTYFEQLWGPDHGWLPPDNIQLEPYRGVAARTSPTNIGFALVAAQAAYDLGWTSRGAFLDRIERTLDAVDRLDSYRGHLYNWYETSGGRRLWPPYVSTADSGNLAASLVVLSSGLEEIARGARPAPPVAEGLADTVRALIALAPASAEAGRALLTAIGKLPAGRAPDAAELKRLLPPAARLEETARSGLEGGRVPASTRRRDTIHGLAAAPRRTLDALLDELETGEGSARERAGRLAERCRTLFDEMDFSFLYERRRGLLAIGYDTETHRLDSSAYDLLASEARLASIVAIVKGDVPAEHWLHLGRPVVQHGDRTTLLSWGGTMFEYLMPLVFTPAFHPSLLAESYAGAVERQRRYGDRRGRPWGTSESQYAAVNSELDYRYRTFGVPGLGLRRGLADDHVVAPYASALALMVDPRGGYENLAALEASGATGVHGFFEAVDFTAARLPAGQDRVIVPTYMAHHAGMIIGAMANVLLNGRVQDLFMRSPRVSSAALLLQERVPYRIVSAVPHPLETQVVAGDTRPAAEPVDHVSLPPTEDRAPRGQFLSNGRLWSYLHQDGRGSVSLGDVALIHADPADARFPLGLFFYVRDLETGRFWSATQAPVPGRPDRLEAWFHLNKVEMARVENWIETFVEAVVSPEDDVDVRRLTITNYSDRPRRLDVTSYAEVVIDDPRAHRTHPAFSKLFVRTERAEGREALLATRRPRDAGADPPWLVHTVACDRARLPEAIRFETDRARFLGRGRGLARPRAMDPGVQLSGTVGHVLDPIVSLQQPFTIGPGERVRLGFCTGAAADRSAAERLADVYDHPAAVERAIGIATTSATLERRHAGLDGARIQAFQQLGSAIHVRHPDLRPGPELLLAARGSQADLWRHGISGDLPIVVARIGSGGPLHTAGWLRDAHTYWGRKGLAVDLVLINDHGPSYTDELQHALESLAERAAGDGSIEGGVFVLRGDRLSDEESALLLSAAAAVFDGPLPEFPLAARDVAHGRGRVDEPAVEAGTDVPAPTGENPGPPVADLVLFNGIGGFEPSSAEYVVRPSPGAPPRPPAPWVNVIANERFGFFVTESGSSTTWSVNSQQRRLSPWFNDPVRDPTGEVIYLRDEKTGSVWSATPEPAGAGSGLEVRHGHGYSVFRGRRDGIDHELTLHVDPDLPVKVARLTLRERDGTDRVLSVYAYLEWVLGTLRSETAPHIVTRLEPGERMAFARNRYDRDHGDRVAFVAAIGDAAGRDFDATCDRRSFLGAELDPARPQAPRHGGRLDGRDGPGLDPCAALRSGARLDAHGTASVAFAIGDAADEAEAISLARRFREPGAADASLDRARGFWRELTGRLQVETPAPELDILLNGWLPYQTLSCRVWGRTAFYQSGGAFGFRDQLQDVMAFVQTRPDIARKQIVLHAAHQFEQGDVLHWWHPPGGRGVRTRISDDLLWLPFVTAFYIEGTGDRGVLDEVVSYLEARALEPDEHEAYLAPRRSAIPGDLYDHCCRAVDHALRFGVHGLPLMGTGDWNDGMNRVGDGGEGESVWLGFFLVSVIDAFLPFVRERADGDRLDRWSRAREDLTVALNDAGWDGEWYRRAYFDDGTPLGAAENEECRIDAIAQAWAVLSGVAPPDRADTALASAERLLVDREASLLRLLTPPFRRSEPDPGYIQGYPPGVRENGGQYTHGVLWLVQALASRGEGDRAVRLLRMMSPANLGRTLDGALTFRNEPYVVTADVYSEPPHAGRGGWSWYTGSGGWMYRIAVESILGFRVEAGRSIRLSPCIPSDWPGYRIEYVAPDGATRYSIRVENPRGIQTGIEEVEVDGRSRPVGERRVRIDLLADGRRHDVRVRMGLAVAGSRQ